MRTYTAWPNKSGRFLYFYTIKNASMADKQPDYTCIVNIDGEEYCVHCPREYIDQQIRLLEQLIDAVQ